MDNQKIGNYIKQKRKEKKLTQQQLGDQIGVSYKAVSKWECGLSLPDISILKKICEILDISIEELLNGKDYAKPRKKKKKIIKITTIIILIIILFLIISKNNNINKSKDCRLIKTYYIININQSNDSNYLYITLTQFQTEGVYTIKIPKSFSKNLEVNKNYEFTFKSSNDYLLSNPNIIFEKCELINIEYTNKVGLEQKNEYTC